MGIWDYKIYKKLVLTFDVILFPYI